MTCGSMAKISVKFLSSDVKKASGKESLDLTINAGETVQQVLLLLGEKFGERFKNVIFSSEGLVRENLVVFVNGQNVMAKNGLKTKVKDGDQIMIFTPIVGG